MRSLSLATTAALAAMVLTAHTSPAQSEGRDDGPEIRVAHLIRQLGASEFNDRQAADDELAKLGTLSRKQLEAASGDADPEVRYRAQSLVKRIKMDELWLPSRVTMSAEKEPTARVLELVGDRTGNFVTPSDSEAAKDVPPVTMVFHETPFWQAIDELAEASGHRLQLTNDRGSRGFRFSVGKPGRYPTAYNGPLRLQLVGAARSFSEKLDYDDRLSSVNHSFELDMSLVWEDRLRLVAYRNRPEVVSAVTDAGQKLTAITSTTPSWNLAGEGDRHATSRLYLRPPSLEASTLKTLTLGWSFIAVGDMTTLEVDSPIDGQTKEKDDLTLTVDTVEKQPGGRYELAVRIKRGLTLPEPPEIMFQENKIELLDADGKAFTPLDRSNFLADGGYKTRITFSRPSTDSVPKTLRVTYPKLRSQREIRLTFNDVPLPATRPE